MPDTEELLNEISKLGAESIHKLIKEIWMLYDDALLKETGSLHNRGEGDVHWEGHL